MRLPILLHTAVSCTEGILTVFTATILGRFADSVFRLDFSPGIRNAISLGLALFAMAAFLPAVVLVANMFMLKYSLVHDRMILGRSLDKKYDSILRYELGDIQKRLVMFYEDAEENSGEKIDGITTIYCENLTYAYGGETGAAPDYFFRPPG